jgi:hypothetical protein
MARKPTGKPVGPPKKIFLWEQFEGLCEIQCTQSEICSVLKLHKQTLAIKIQEMYGEDYCTVYKRFSEGGHASLRRSQFKMSQKNCAMAIWLGKQWLGQKDHNDDKLPINDAIINHLLIEIKMLKDKNAPIPEADQIVQ